jgi:hypothetical protein
VTSGFSRDVACAPTVLHAFARVNWGDSTDSTGATCNTHADGTVVTITNPVDAAPVEYYSYFTHPRSCSNPDHYAFGTTSYTVLNADAEKNETKPDVESQQEDDAESALPNPAIEPDTTVYAAHVEVCSTTMSGRQPNGYIYYLAPSCTDQERVNIEVVNHKPGG